MEIELRAKIIDRQQLDKRIKLLDGIIEKVAEEKQIDTYLKNENDAERKMVVRIRRNFQNNKAVLTFKGRSRSTNPDIAWADFDTPIEDPDRLEAVLTENGYVYVCLIDKIRQSFDYKDFEINIDDVKDLGLFIEIEKQDVEDNIEKCKNEIIVLFEELGISENNLINQGYVPLMINQNNGARS